jgi:hypothetical protein
MAVLPGVRLLVTAQVVVVVAGMPQAAADLPDIVLLPTGAPTNAWWSCIASTYR